MIKQQNEAERASIRKMLDLALDINEMHRARCNPTATFCFSETAGCVRVNIFADWHMGFDRFEELLEVEMPTTRWLSLDEYDPDKADEAIQKLETFKKALWEDKGRLIKKPKERI